tara:strand:- start:120 stop:401 length:282 start_codon:yes stop_codon:yes gene_type:complete
MDLGKAIKEIRKRKCINQKDFAFMCGISSNSLCQIEKGNNHPKKSTIKKVCEVLEIPQSYLLFYSIESEDVPKDKQAIFHALSGIRDLLIDKH